ncbi:MAG: hypothetical protein ORN49_07510, partial [Rhodobacteraceae bacterium]|nr:hypothetical protein [Paracoccaceae bacterium]
MSASIIQMADRIAELIEARMGIKGEGLEAKLKRGGQHLPRKVLGAALFLAEAAGQAQNPKLFIQLDMERAAQAYDICARYLNSASPIYGGLYGVFRTVT